MSTVKSQRPLPSISALSGALLLSATLVSCGGNDKELLTGVFSDSPVSGLRYATGSNNTGVTNAEGEFQYQQGDTVVFSIGRLVLPVVLASDFVTPLDMVTDTDVTDPAVVNVVRLLQSLDTDNNPENGISIPANAVDVFSEPVVFDASDSNAVDAVVEKMYGTERQVVSEADAIAHFVQTLSSDAGSEGALDQLSYLVLAGDSFSGDSLFVDEQAFSLTVSNTVSDGNTTINHGVYQLSGAEEQWFVSVSNSDNQSNRPQLACFAKAPQPVNRCDGDLYYVFAEEQAAIEFNTAPQESGVNTDQRSENTDDLNIGAANEIEDTGPEPDELSVDEVVAVTPKVQPPGVQDGTQNESPGTLQSGSTIELQTEVITESEEVPLQTLFPLCDAGIVDDDNDGFGWQNNNTCLIVVDNIVIAEELSQLTADSDVDESQTAPVEEATDQTIQAAGVQGQTTEKLSAATEASSQPVLAPESMTTAVTAADITDIIVLTGQSNAAALETEYDATLDAGHERLFAFNTDGQWRPADLSQYWDMNLPSNFSEAGDDRDPYNNLVFQLGKSLVQQTDRVIGVILIAAPGEGISHWDFNSNFYNAIRSKVSAALAELPQKTTVDAMIWMQGETDWLAEGTADPGATGFSSTDSGFYQNYYPNKLSQLTSNLRSERWFGAEAQFICSETKKAALNKHLTALNNDGDALTSCAAASDLPTRAGDQFGNHFSAAGLRTLGARIAELYLAADQ